MRYHAGMNDMTEQTKITREWLAKVEAACESAATTPDSAFVAGLSGHLGAGKTAFVKQIARELGVEEEVTSPTFVLMKIYPTKHPTLRRLVHIDAYRLERRADLEALRWEDVVADPHNLVMIEWPENVGMNEGDPELNAWLKFEIREGKYVIEVE